jgi:hypothetical protein
MPLFSVVVASVAHTTAPPAAVDPTADRQHSSCLSSASVLPPTSLLKATRASHPAGRNATIPKACPASSLIHTLPKNQRTRLPLPCRPSAPSVAPHMPGPPPPPLPRRIILSKSQRPSTNLFLLIILQTQMPTIAAIAIATAARRFHASTPSPSFVVFHHL